MLIARFYATVGHGGASGSRRLALAGYPPARSSDGLMLNIFVATIAAIDSHVSHGSARSAHAFRDHSVPCAFIAGRFWTLDGSAYAPR